jgi:hypothetical protein
MKHAILAAAALALLAGCAQTQTSKDEEPKEQKEYITGSNLPKRDRGMGSGVVTVKPEDFEKGRNNATGASAPRTGG